MKGNEERKKYSVWNIKYILIMTVIIIVGVLVLGSLSGCGKGKNDADGTQTENGQGTDENGIEAGNDALAGGKSGTDATSGTDNAVTDDDFYDPDAYAYSLKKKICGEAGNVLYNDDSIIVCNVKYDYDAIDDNVYPDNGLSIDVSYYDYDGNKQDGGYTLYYDYSDGVFDINCDKGGNIYFIRMMSSYIEYEGYSYAYEIAGYDRYGELAQCVIFEDSPSDYVIKDIITEDDGRIFALTSEGLEIFEDGEAVDKIRIGDPGELSSFYRLRNGDLAVMSYGVDDYDITIVNTESRKLTSADSTPFSFMNLYDTSEGTDTDLILLADNGVCTYNMGDAGYKKIMSFPVYNEFITGLTDVHIAENGDIYGIYYEGDTGDNILGIFSPYDFSNDKRKVLTLAGVDIYDDIYERVVDFNRDNKEYRIKLLDYADMHIDTDYTTGAEALNDDILSGRTPDILQAGYYTCFREYMAMGLLADQKHFIERDNDISLDDYAPNVIEALSLDDKLYVYAPGFYINTAFAKSYNISGMGNSLGAYLSVYGRSDAGAFGDVLKETLMYNIFRSTSGDYIDWESLSCDFDNVDFKKLISYVNTYPKDYDYSSEGWNYYAYDYQNDLTICEIRTLYDIDSYLEAYQGVFASPVTMVGYPTLGDVGSSIGFDYGLAVFNSSAYKDGAWSFIKPFYDTDISEDITGNGLPVAKKGLEAAVRGAGGMQKIYYGDDDYEWEPRYYSGGEEPIELKKLTDKECDALIEDIYRINRLECDSTALQTIMDEELSGYFMGAYDASTAAESLQEKITEYFDTFKRS